MIIRFRFPPHPWLGEGNAINMDGSRHLWSEPHFEDVLVDLPTVPRMGEWIWLDIDQPELPEDGGTHGRYLVKQVMWIITRECQEPWVLLHNIS